MKSHMGQSLGETRLKLPRDFSQWSNRKALNSSSMNCACVTCWLPGAREGLGAPGFYWELSRYWVPRAFYVPKFHSLGGIQHNHIVCVTSLTQWDSFTKVVKTLPTPKSPMPTKSLGSQTHEWLSWNDALLPPLLELLCSLNEWMNMKKNAHKW